MTIETKFSKGDEAWYMKDNKPTRVEISCVETFNVETNQDYIMYNAKDYHEPKTWLDHQKLREEILFPTKEALLQSL